MARRPQKQYTDEDFSALEGRASKSEQKRAVQRMAALGEQLAELSVNQIKKLPVEERLVDALLDVKEITAFEARRRQFSRIGKLLRNEDETMILSYLTPQQGLKKKAQLVRWVDRIVEQGDSAVHEFSKSYNATDKHTLRQHVLRYCRAQKLEATPEELEQEKQKIMNYVQQVALLSDQGKAK